jgi:hypothetical protein
MNNVEIGDIVKFTIVGYVKTAIVVNILDNREVLLMLPSQQITETNSVLWLPINKLESTGKNIFIFLNNTDEIINSLSWLVSDMIYKNAMEGTPPECYSKELKTAIELVKILKKG